MHNSGICILNFPLANSIEKIEKCACLGVSVWILLSSNNLEVDTAVQLFWLVYMYWNFPHSTEFQLNWLWVTGQSSFVPRFDCCKCREYWDTNRVKQLFLSIPLMFLSHYSAFFLVHVCPTNGKESRIMGHEHERNGQECSETCKECDLNHCYLYFIILFIPNSQNKALQDFLPWKENPIWNVLLGFFSVVVLALPVWYSLPVWWFLHYSGQV